MKFYLTKSAQLAAEGKPAKAPKGRPAKASAPEAPSVAPPAEMAAAVAPATATIAGSGSDARRTARRMKAEKVAPAPKAPKAAKAVKNSLVVGGVPRVDLLPQEVRAERRGGQTVRRAWLGVVAVAALVVIGIAGATLYATNANNTLAESQSQTSGFIAEQGKYTKVKTAREQVDLIKDAQSIGGSTEIDWTAYLAKVQATLPSGVVVTAIDLTSSSPLVAYAQATTPLQGSRVATLTFTATSATLPSVPAWLDGLTQLPGYTDATAGSVDAAEGKYTTEVTMHINEAAYSGRFTTKGK